MSKILKDAALIVGVVALAATGIGAAASAGIIGVGVGATATVAGVSAATLSAVGLAASVAAAGLSVISTLTAKKPANVGNPMAWTADPQAGIPYIMGVTYIGGQIVYRQAYGKDDKSETIITVLGAGPIQSVDTLYVDNIATTISGTTVNISDRGKMSASYQLGAQPEVSQLGALGPPDWSTTSKLSGLAATSITLQYDAKGSVTFTTEPQVGWVVHGVKVYDPRLDSTYPGGSGAQRSNDETTWTYSDNPYLHALTWLIGRRQNGHLMMGVGVPIAGILISQFVEGANVADTNGWKISGTLSSTDDKWSRLKDILQAGGGEPIRLGAQIGCIINTPRVSLATITIDDVVGDASVQATQAKRDRINAIVPRYTAQQSVTTEKADGSGLQTAVTWAVTAGSPVIVADYVTFDGKQRQKEVDYTFVADLTQSQQLARYDIENAREFGPITLPMKLRWMGYKPGDVVTANLPELGLNGQDILILQRELSPADGTVTITARSETSAKHAFALGQTGTAPATPSVTGPALVSTPGNSSFAITATSYTANDMVVPALVITGEADSDAIDGIIFEYRLYDGTDGPDDNWSAAGIEPPATAIKALTAVVGGVAYEVSVRYRVGSNLGGRLILGPETPDVPKGLGGPGSWTIVDRQNMTVVGSTVSKTGGSGNWGDASVCSAESYVNGSLCAFSPAQTTAELMVGLNTDPGTDDGYTSIDYAWYVNSGQAQVYESGSMVAGSWTYAIGDIFSVQYDGARVIYAQNGVQRHVTTAAAGLVLYLDSAFKSVGGKVTNLAFAGSGAKGNDGLDGTNGLPGAPGADGTSQYIHVAYADSADGSADFTTGAIAGRTYIGTLVDHVAADSTNYADYTWSKFVGLDGTDGTPGAPGADGRPSYVHFAYANSADGSVDFTDGAPGSRTYIGVYTDETPADSGDYHAYRWSLIKGADGTNALAITASPAALIVSCDSSGSPRTGQFDKTSQLQLLLGATDETASASYEIDTNSCSATVSHAGVVTFTAMSADHGYADVTATFGGTAINQRITIDKVRDGATSAPASYPPMIIGIGTTTYPNPLVLAAGASLAIYADISCLTGSANGSGVLKIQTSPSGAGTWSDLATSSGTASYTPSEPLGLDASGTLTNSTGAKSAFDVRTTVTTSGGAPGAVQKTASFLTFGS